MLNHSIKKVACGLSVFLIFLFTGLALAETTESSHTCASTTLGEVKCWGDAGDGTASLFPIDLSEIDPIAIAAGESHTCALTRSGGVKCWGNNLDGELGNGTTIDSAIPVDVLGLNSNVIAIASGLYHTCALTGFGGVKCWGRNVDGELGDGTTDDSPAPVEPLGQVSGIRAISAGYGHTCALTILGGANCWGDNQYGQLGDGTASSSRNWVSIASGGDHTCALARSGAVSCWGNNSAGQLGDGTDIPYRNNSVEVVSLSGNVTAISVGGDHSCALTDSGAVSCWGSNSSGQLGDGTDEPSSNHPVELVSFSNEVVSIALRDDSVCGFLASDDVKCWGNNGSGQLDNGVVAVQAVLLPKTRVPSRERVVKPVVVAIAASGSSSCVMMMSIEVKCWGGNRQSQFAGLSLLIADTASLFCFSPRSVSGSPAFSCLPIRNPNRGDRSPLKVMRCSTSVVFPEGLSSCSKIMRQRGKGDSVVKNLPFSISVKWMAETGAPFGFS